MSLQPAKHCIASVVLIFFGDADLLASVLQKLAQEDVDHCVIIVEKASNPVSVKRLEAWLRIVCRDAVIGTPDEVDHHIYCCN